MTKPNDKEDIMKKAAVVVVIIGLVSVLGFGSVLEHVDRISDLMRRCTAIVQWATGSPYTRHLSAAVQMEMLVEHGEMEILAAMQEVKSLLEAQTILVAMYGIAGMRIGAEGMRDLDVGKLTVAAYLLKYAASRGRDLLRIVGRDSR
jgi:hypothetical protein